MYDDERRHRKRDWDYKDYDDYDYSPQIYTKEDKLSLTAIIIEVFIILSFIIKLIAIGQLFLHQTDLEMFDLFITIPFGVLKLCALIVNQTSVRSYQCTFCIFFTYAIVIDHAVFLVLYIIDNDKFGYIISSIILVLSILDIIPETIIIRDRKLKKIEEQRLVEEREKRKAEQIANSDFIASPAPMVTP